MYQEHEKCFCGGVSVHVLYVLYFQVYIHTNNICMANSAPFSQSTTSYNKRQIYITNKDMSLQFKALALHVLY